MKLQSNILLKQFAESIADEYPNLTEEEIINICKSNWEYIGLSMASGELPVIRQKYFGTFIPYPARVRGMLKKLIKKHSQGKMEDNDFFEMRTNLENYLENVEKHKSLSSGK